MKGPLLRFRCLVLNHFIYIKFISEIVLVGLCTHRTLFSWQAFPFLFEAAAHTAKNITFPHFCVAFAKEMYVDIPRQNL